MNCIPVFKTKLYQASISIVFLCIGVIAFGQLPPVPVHSSSAGPDDQPPVSCPSAPSNQTKRSLTFAFENRYKANIALVNFDKDAFSANGLESNSIVSITYDNDGFTSEQWPIWEPGIHYITLHFANDINTTSNYSNCYSIYLDFWHKNLRDRQFRRYQARGNFRATVSPVESDADSSYISGDTEKSDNHLVPVEKKRLTSIASAGTSVILDVQDEENPISIYIAGVTNPSYKHVIANSEFYPSGKHQIHLEDLDTGLYQIIVKQGSQLKHMKHMHIKE